MENPFSSSAAGEPRAALASLGDSSESAHPLASSEGRARVQGASAVRLAADPAPTVAKLRIARRENNDAFERDYLARVLTATNQNVTRAAKLAGVSRQQIQRLMIKHEVKRGEPSAPAITRLR